MIERKCLICGKVFFAKQCVVRRGWGKYCSYACLGKRDKSGDKNPKWRGGKMAVTEGRMAIYCPDHPPTGITGGKHVFEYQLVAEKKIGRFLLPGEIVHHINGNIHDNKPENLEVMTQSKHAGLHCINRRNPETGRFI